MKKNLLLIASLVSNIAISFSMDKQTQIFLEEYNSQNFPPLESIPLKDFRQDESFFRYETNFNLHEIKDILIPGSIGEIPMRIYLPNKQDNLPVILLIHGGGWVWGSINSHDTLARELCAACQAIIVAVDYRLAPEHKFPEGLNDCVAALKWVSENISKYQGNPDKITILGDSAGGNLSAAVTHIARDNKIAKIISQVLIYPVLDSDFETDSYNRCSKNYFLTKQNMKWFWSLYINSEEDLNNHLAAPLRASEFSNLPPALVITTDFDPLQDEAKKYAQNLKKANVPVTELSYNTIHCFISLASKLDIGKKAIKDIAEFIKNS